MSFQAEGAYPGTLWWLRGVELVGEGMEAQEGEDIYINYGWFTLLYCKNQYNIVKQFSSI